MSIINKLLVDMMLASRSLSNVNIEDSNFEWDGKDRFLFSFGSSVIWHV
jgi:hypothetical protein